MRWLLVMVAVATSSAACQKPPADKHATDAAVPDAAPVVSAAVEVRATTSKSGKWIAAWSTAKTDVYERATGRAIASLPAATSDPRAAVFSHDEKRLALVTPAGITVVDVEPPNAVVRKVDLAGTIVGLGWRLDDYAIDWIDAAGHVRSLAMTETSFHDESNVPFLPTRVAYADDTKLSAVAKRGGIVILDSSLVVARPLAEVEPAAVVDMAFDPAGKSLAVVFDHREASAVHLYDVATGKRTKILSPDPKTEGRRRYDAVAFSRDGLRLGVAGESHAYVVDIGTNGWRATSGARARSVAWSDRDELVVGGASVTSWSTNGDMPIVRRFGDAPSDAGLRR